MLAGLFGLWTQLSAAFDAVSATLAQQLKAVRVASIVRVGRQNCANCRRKETTTSFTTTRCVRALIADSK